MLILRDETGEKEPFDLSGNIRIPYYSDRSDQDLIHRLKEAFENHTGLQGLVQLIRSNQRKRFLSTALFEGLL